MTVEPEVKQFLKKSKGLIDEHEEPIPEFVELLKRENMRQIKEQLAADLAPILSRLTHIEQQQESIIELLKAKLDLDVYEKQIMDLMKKQLEKE